MRSRRLIRPVTFDRFVAAVIGVTLGAALGLMFDTGHNGAILVTVPLAAALGVLVSRLVPDDHRKVVLALILFAFAIRAALAIGVFAGAEALGRRGFVTGDDAAYSDLAWNWLQYVHGNPQEPWVPPAWNANLYLFGVYTYFVAAVFSFVGHDPVAAEVVNGAMATASLVLFYDLARHWFDRRAALLTAVVTGLLPSAALWSALNLKDAGVYLLVSIVMWVVGRFGSLRVIHVALGVASFLLLRGLRSYVFLALAIAVPIAMFVLPRLPRAERMRAALVATAISVVSIAILGAPGLTSGNLFTTIESVRYGMAYNARTGYYEPPPVLAQSGDVFVVTTAPPDVLVSRPITPAPGGPQTTPRVIVVQPGTRVVLETPAPNGPAPSPAFGVVSVRPGDVVVVGSPGQTMRPDQSPRNLLLNDRRGVPAAQVEAPSYESDSLVVNRTLSHIPVGLTYALLAPFPWDIRRPADLLTIPEVLLWYVSVAAGFVTLWSHRSRWRVFIAPLLFSCLLVGLFVFVEANTGTLFRHRSMILPYAILLASPTLVSAFQRGAVTIGLPGAPRG